MFLWLGRGVLILQWIIILSMLDDALTGHRLLTRRRTMGNNQQLDILSALYHYEEEEAQAARRWSTFLSQLRHIKMLMILCRQTKEDVHAMWAIDDLIIAVAILDHKLTASQTPLVDYVNKKLDIEINSYFTVESDRIADNVARITLPLIPHQDSGIILARDKVHTCILNLKNVL